jgi:PAS domain S-box-containing protein
MEDVKMVRLRASRQEAVFGSLALVVALGIFAVDTFTHIEGAVAVLYVVPILLAAEVVNRIGLLLVAAIFMLLSFTSFSLTHLPDPDLQTILRFCVALAALSVTTALLLRNANARAALLKTNDALRNSEARYRSIFELTRVALWERDYSTLRDYLADLKTRGVTDLKSYAQVHPEFLTECAGKVDVVDANEAARVLLGFLEGGAHGHDMKRVIPKDSEAFVALLQAIMDGDRYFEGTAEVFNQDGGRRVVLLGVNFPENPSDFNRLVVSMVDVTQREEAQKALADAQAELARASKAATIGALSASLAHELNQPLGAIAVNSQTLVRWLDKDPPDINAAKRSAERILRDSNRASDIVKNTRSIMLSTPKECEVIDVNALIQDTLALMDHDLQRDRLEVEVIRKTGTLSVMAVRIEMQQVLINLIINAGQAMRASHSTRRLVTIVLDAPDDTDYVSIAVRDTGDGLTAEVQENLFKPFFTTKETGMGVGLSICRNTIESLGGTLTGRNHPDGGAVFEIRLPKEPAHA